jgi:hypothetical protein
MVRLYSTDLRDHIVGSVAGGRLWRALAVLCGVSVASVVKWSQGFRATGRGGIFWAVPHRPSTLTWLPLKIRGNGTTDAARFFSSG